MLDADTEQGTLVSYYLEGWRAGYVEEVKGEKVKIRPIPPYKGAQPHSKWVPISDVEVCESR